jgi:hypothetical protein
LSCLAVSQTSDATGSYYLYAFQQQAEGRSTGQKLAIWPDAYYLNTSITYNSVYAGPSACAVDRTQMLSGQTATMQCVQINNTQLTGMLPCDMDGPTPPPAGSPNYFLVEGPKKSNSLYLYKLHVEFTNPANTALTGPVQIAVAPYTASGQVPQFGTTQKLNTNGAGLMLRLSYRNFANAKPPYETLVATNSVVANKGVGMRWYEIRNPASTPVVYQQGTYAPNSSLGSEISTNKISGSETVFRVLYANLFAVDRKHDPGPSQLEVVTCLIPAPRLGTINAVTLSGVTRRGEAGAQRDFEILRCMSPLWIHRTLLRNTRGRQNPVGAPLCKLGQSRDILEPSVQGQAAAQGDKQGHCCLLHFSRCWFPSPSAERH